MGSLDRYQTQNGISTSQPVFEAKTRAKILLLNWASADPDRLPSHAGRHLCRRPVRGRVRGAVRCGGDWGHQRFHSVPGSHQGPQGAALPLQEEVTASLQYMQICQKKVEQVARL